MKQFISLKALLVGIVLCFLVSVGEPVAVWIVHGSPLCANFATGGAVFLFFILVFIVNSLLKLTNSRFVLDSHELIVVYVMMIVACAIPSWGFVMMILCTISGAYYYAIPGNKWAELIHPHIKPWLVPQDTEAIRTFFEGLPKGESIPWGAWLIPVISWFSLILAIYFVMICLSVIMRKQWVENERLLFPLTQVPLEMSRSDERCIPPFFRNRIMWMGFAVPLIVYSINGLHSYFPFVPEISLRGPHQIRILFEVIGLAFLLSRDISLSLWFFALLGIIEKGFFDRIGFSIGPMQIYSDPGPQTVANQGLGAMIVFVAMSLWVARSHLKDVVRKAFRGAREVDDSGEMLSYRTSVLGIVIGFIFIATWLVFSGLNVVSTLVFLFFGFVIFIGLTKIVAQAGLAYGRPPVAPSVATNYALGSSFVGLGGLTCLGFALAWAGDIRTMVMTSATNGLKLTDSAGIKGRRIFVCLICAIIVALVSTSWMALSMGYRHGAINFGGWQARGLPNCVFDWTRSFIEHPVPLGKAQYGWMGIGGVLMFLVTLARSRFLWWPVHPVGLALGLAGPFCWVWFSVFLAWLVKGLIVKFLGIKAHKTARFFFLGMVLGSFVTAGIWLAIDFFTGMQGNVFTLG